MRKAKTSSPAGSSPATAPRATPAAGKPRKTAAPKPIPAAPIDPAVAVPVEHGSQAAISNICVYCGSGPGARPIYAQAARALGQSLAAGGVGLVYGGGGLGLMGEVARATLEAGGRVTGIIPKFLIEKEHVLTDANEIIVTEDMHVRKRLMFEHSDAFVALPGGIGTLEELVEQLTWSQLGRHTKPIVVANIEGFWDPFLKLLAHMRDDQFIRNGLNVRFIVVDSAEAILPAIRAAAASTQPRASDRALTAHF
jgi:uncharacterized protein (TIGR00730 family)